MTDHEMPTLTEIDELAKLKRQRPWTWTDDRIMETINNTALPMVVRDAVRREWDARSDRREGR